MTAVSIAYAMHLRQLAPWVILAAAVGIVIWRVCADAKVGRRADAIRRRLDELAEVIGR